MQGNGKKLYRVLVIGLLSVCLIVGVLIRKQSKEEVVKEPIKVGMTLYNAEDVFVSNTWERISYYIEELRKQKGLDITIEAVDSKHNQELQNEQIDSFIREGYDIIIANTVEREEASMIIDKVQSAQIPIIFFNREPVPQDMKKWEKIYYVGSSAEQAGAMQGEILADAMDKGLSVDKNKDGKIQYVMIEGEYGHQDAILRTYHCIKKLEERGFQMENVATDTGMWRKEEGKAKMSEWLENFGNKIEVVLANNDEMALGAIEALKVEGYFQNGKAMPVIGVDGIDTALGAIKADLMLGTVLNDSDEQAKCIVAKIFELSTGEKGVYILNTVEEETIFG